MAKRPQLAQMLLHDRSQLGALHAEQPRAGNKDDINPPDRRKDRPEKRYGAGSGTDEM